MSAVSEVATGEPKAPSAGWGTLAPILVVHLCGTLGFSLALPILVFLMTDLGGAPWAYGLLGATYSAAQMIGAPLLGRWSDRTGRREVLALSQGGTVVAWALFLLALQLPREGLGSLAGTTLSVPLFVVFLARLLDGLTGGNVSVANAYVADLTRGAERERQKAFGRMGMAASVGFTAGPALAGLLATESDPYTGPIAAALAISLVGAVLSLRLREPTGRCPEGPPPAGALTKALTQQQRRCDRARSGASETRSLRAPAVRLVIAMTFVMFLAFNVFYAAFPIHATARIGWGAAELGFFYSTMSASMFLAQGPLLEVTSRRLSGGTVFALGLTGLVLAFVAFTSPDRAIAYLGSALFALGNGLAWPTFQARTASLVPESAQGGLQGALSSAGSLAAIAGLALGGMLYPLWGGQVFLLGSVLFATVALVLPRTFRERAPST